MGADLGGRYGDRRSRGRHRFGGYPWRQIRRRTDPRHPAGTPLGHGRLRRRRSGGGPDGLGARVAGIRRRIRRGRQSAARGGGRRCRPGGHLAHIAADGGGSEQPYRRFLRSHPRRLVHQHPGRQGRDIGLEAGGRRHTAARHRGRTRHLSAAGSGRLGNRRTSPPLSNTDGSPPPQRGERAASGMDTRSSRRETWPKHNGHTVLSVYTALYTTNSMREQRIPARPRAASAAGAGADSIGYGWSPGTGRVAAGARKRKPSSHECRPNRAAHICRNQPSPAWQRFATPRTEIRTGPVGDTVRDRVAGHRMR